MLQFFRPSSSLLLFNRALVFGDRQANTAPIVHYIRNVPECDELMRSIQSKYRSKSSRLSISCESGFNITSSTRGAQSKHFAIQTISLADAKGVIILHLPPKISSSNEPQELIRILTDPKVYKVSTNASLEIERIEKQFRCRLDSFLCLRDRFERLLNKESYPKEMNKLQIASRKFHDFMSWKLLGSDPDSKSIESLENLSYDRNLEGTQALQFLVNRVWSTHLLDLQLTYLERVEGERLRNNASTEQEMIELRDWLEKRSLLQRVNRMKFPF